MGHESANSDLRLLSLSIQGLGFFLCKAGMVTALKCWGMGGGGVRVSTQPKPAVPDLAHMATNKCEQ